MRLSIFSPSPGNRFYNESGFVGGFFSIESISLIINNKLEQNKDFKAQIYHELDYKLRQTPWESGVAEAHGLVCGLVCIGSTGDTIHSKSHLFQLTSTEDISLIESLGHLIHRDLNDIEFSFQPMLPGEDASDFDQAEAISNWCQGFLQGFLHADAQPLDQYPFAIQEAIDDIMEIGHIELDPESDNDNDFALSEVKEFLRVAVQLIYEECQADSTPLNSTTIN